MLTRRLLVTHRVLVICRASACFEGVSSHHGVSLACMCEWVRDVASAPAPVVVLRLALLLSIRGARSYQRRCCCKLTLACRNGMLTHRKCRASPDMQKHIQRARCYAVSSHNAHLLVILAASHGFRAGLDTATAYAGLLAVTAVSVPDSIRYLRGSLEGVCMVSRRSSVTSWLRRSI